MFSGQEVSFGLLLLHKVFTTRVESGWRGPLRRLGGAGRLRRSAYGHCSASTPCDTSARSGYSFRAARSMSASIRSTDPHPAHEAQPLEHAPPSAKAPFGAWPLSHSPRVRMRRTAKADRTASTASTNIVPGVNTNAAMRFSFSRMRFQRGAHLWVLPHCCILEPRAQAVRVNVIQLSYALQSAREAACALYEVLMKSGR